MLTTPNLLTSARIILAPFFVYLLWCNINEHNISTEAVVLFLIIIVTDAFDGFIARLRKKTSIIGSFIDPLADKLLFIPTFLILYVYNFISSLVFFTYILREILLIAGWLKIYVTRKNIKTVVRFSGKIFTIAEAVFILLILTKASIKVINLASILFVIITIYSILDNAANTKRIFYEST